MTTTTADSPTAATRAAARRSSSPRATRAASHHDQSAPDVARRVRSRTARAAAAVPVTVTMTSPGRWQASRAGVPVARFYWARQAQLVSTMTSTAPIGALTRRGSSALSRWDAHDSSGRVVALDLDHDDALAALIDHHAHHDHDSTSGDSGGS